MGTRLRQRAVLLVFATFSFGPLSCGGSPARPSEQPPTLTILSPSDVVHVGATVDMMLKVVFADGRSAMITPVWGTTRPDIVHVKPLSASKQFVEGEIEGWTKTGTIDHMLFARVTGLAEGDAVVTADTEFGSCQRGIRVLGN